MNFELAAGEWLMRKAWCGYGKGFEKAARRHGGGMEIAWWRD
jgi:hypothetical protein